MDARRWNKVQLVRTKNSKYRSSDKQKPDPTVARVNKRLASRFHQPKTGTASKAPRLLRHMVEACSAQP